MALSNGMLVDSDSIVAIWLNCNRLAVYVSRSLGSLWLNCIMRGGDGTAFRVISKKNEEEDAMATMQIDLTQAECEALRKLAMETGKTEKQLLCHALGLLCGHGTTQENLSALQKGKAIWKNRNDLPDFASLRKEMDR